MGLNCNFGAKGKAKRRKKNGIMSEKNPPVSLYMRAEQANSADGSTNIL